jgi:hypothetical protein
MTTWFSTSNIAEEFGLTAYAKEPEALRNELRKIVSELHPDKNAGNFKTDADKEKFLRAKEALEFLDAEIQNSGALIPIAQLPAVIKAVSEALAVRPSVDTNSLHSTMLAETRSHLSRRFAVPKIGSGVFAAISGFLVTFSDKFEKNAILGPFLNDRVGQMFLLTLMAYSGLFFLMMWYREKRAEARAEYLMSESALRDIFEKVASDARTNTPAGRVSSRQIMEAAQDVAGFFHWSRANPFAFFSPGIDLATIEKATTLQTQRLVERRLLKRLELPSVDTWYEVQNTQ